MAEEIKYFASNMRAECNRTECLTCSYFDCKSGHCSADEKIKDCDFCKNAFTDLRFDKENDLSYLSIGQCENGFSAFIRATSVYKPPIQILVQQYRNDLKHNVDIFCFTPAYCPMCGRKITENEPFIKGDK